MTPEFGRTEWDRAVDSLRGAHLLVTNGDFDGAASRAYYAAFHAVTALFALEGRAFSKHGAVKTAVHRDLVKAGRWSAELCRARNVKRARSALASSQYIVFTLPKP